MGYFLRKLVYAALGFLMLLSLVVVGLSAVGLYYIENTQDHVKNLGIKPEVANVAKSSSVMCIVVGVIGFIVACITAHQIRVGKLNNQNQSQRQLFGQSFKQPTNTQYNG